MIRFTIPIRTTNPNNGPTGNSRLAGIIRTRTRKAQRQAARAHTLAAVGLSPMLPCVVTVCRVAPSDGLDPHDGLGASLKGIIDGIADALGLANDRDPRVEWKPTQRRGPAGRYSVEVTVEAVEAYQVAKTRPGATSSEGGL